MLRSAIALLALAVPALTILSSPKPAFACSLAGFPSADVRLEQQTKAADLIFIGQVVDERPTSAAWTQPAYTSTIETGKILKGDAPGKTITLSPLGFLGPDCSGGPRLAAGERVLLFLQKGEPSWIPGARPEGWRIALAGQGKYLLSDGEAYYQAYGPAEHAGPEGGLVKKIAALMAELPEDIKNAPVTPAFSEGAVARFTGSVTINGRPAFEGAPVVAQVSGRNCGSGVVSDGTYELEVASDEAKGGCGTGGATVAFVLGGEGDPGGTHADQSGIWTSAKAGEASRIDLNFTTTEGAAAAGGRPVGIAPSWMAFAAVAMAAAGGLALLVWRRT